MARDYQQLKQTINNTLNRNDLVDYVAATVEDVIREYQRSFFYKTDQTDVVYTSTDNTPGGPLGGAIYPLPTDMVSITYMRLNQSGVWQWMRKTEYETILLMDTLVVPTRSVPSMWSVFDGGFRIYNQPNIVYALELTGNGRIPVPTDEATINFWTDDAAPMIMYATLARIYRLRIKNYDAAQAAEAQAEKFRVEALMRETWSRAVNRQVSAWW